MNEFLAYHAIEKNFIKLPNDSKEKILEEKELVYVREILKEKHAYFFTLSDETKQIIFRDLVEILICEKIDEIDYIDKDRTTQVLPLLNIMKLYNLDLKERLNYIRYVNYNTVKNKLTQKLELQKQREEIKKEQENTEKL